MCQGALALWQDAFRKWQEGGRGKEEDNIVRIAVWGPRVTDTQVGGSQVCENEGKNSKIKQFSAQEQKRREGPLVESQGCPEEARITTGWKNTVSGENVG